MLARRQRLFVCWIREGAPAVQLPARAADNSLLGRPTVILPSPVHRQSDGSLGHGLQVDRIHLSNGPLQRQLSLGS